MHSFQNGKIRIPRELLKEYIKSKDLQKMLVRIDDFFMKKSSILTSIFCKSFASREYLIVYLSTETLTYHFQSVSGAIELLGAQIPLSEVPQRCRQEWRGRDAESQWDPGQDLVPEQEVSTQVKYRSKNSFHIAQLAI